MVELRKYRFHRQCLNRRIPSTEELSRSRSMGSMRNRAKETSVTVLLRSGTGHARAFVSSTKSLSNLTCQNHSGQSTNSDRRQHLL
ncbi:MAG: hypothetical protein CLLPBCKN_004095 [Chroococcidiopsis cubana SAG 39.79]|nr:hypothetical protein [Chroococcidiopsis cubana SAG 39.79]